MTTKIHQACASAGRYMITEGSDDPAVVIARLLATLSELAPEVYEQLTMPGCGFATFPSYAMEDSKSEWWQSADGEAALTSLMEALNEHAPDGFALMPEHDWMALGFFPLDQTLAHTCVVPFSETPTKWHPTTRDFAPLIRGGFDTVALADDWAAKHLERQPYSVRTFRRLDNQTVAELARPSGVVPTEPDDDEPPPSGGPPSEKPDSNFERWRGQYNNEVPKIDGPETSVLDCMFSWHGGQGTALYAAASNWFSGHAVRVDTARRALAELDRCSLQPNFSDSDHDALELLRAHVGEDE